MIVLVLIAIAMLVVATGPGGRAWFAERAAHWRATRRAQLPTARIAYLPSGRCRPPAS